MPAKASPGRATRRGRPSVGAHGASSPARSSMTWSGGGSRPGLGLLARGGAAEDEDRLQAGAAAALDVGGDPVADHRHPARRRRAAAAGQVEEVALGLAADLGAGAAGGLDRGEDRAGPRPGAAGHRQRRVAAGRERAPRRPAGPASPSAAPRSRSRGGRRRRPTSASRAASPSSSSRPAAGDRSWKASAPITKALAPVARRSAASRAVDSPAVTIRSGPTSTPGLAQPLRVDRRPAGPGCW